MGKPSIVPELFFDLIARAVPGGILLTGLILAVPLSRETAVDVVQNPSRLPPFYVSATLALLAAYVAGFWLQIASEFLMKLPWFSFDGARTGIATIAAKGRGRGTFNPDTCKMLERRVRRLFDLNMADLTFYLCFDYVRTRTANGPTVVKCFGESQCLCSLAVALVLIAVVAFATAPVLAGLLMAGAGISCVGMVRRRRSAMTRLFISLLLDD